MMRNFEKVKSFCEETRERMIKLIKKSVEVEDLLAQPEATFAMAECLKIFDESCDLMKEQARQLDEMNEIVAESYKTIRMMNDTINDLRKEVKELGAH